MNQMTILTSIFKFLPSFLLCLIFWKQNAEWLINFTHLFAFMSCIDSFSSSKAIVIVEELEY